MSTLSDNKKLCRLGDIYGIYPYVSRMTVYAHNQGKEMLKYQTRVYNFKKQGLLREFFQQKIVKISKDIKADMIIAVPSSDCKKIGILPEIFGSIIIREKMVKQAKYSHKDKLDPADSCSLSVDIEGKKILLVDDICTTGSTMHAFKEYLEQNGGNVIGMLACGVKYSAADYIPAGFKDGTMPDEIGTNVPDKIKADTPLTMAEYARLHNMSQPAVKKAIQSGRLQSNGKVGHDCRVWGKLAESSRITVPASASDAPNQPLADAKLEKLRADIELQRMRINQNRSSQRREFAEIFIEEYVRAFAPLKAELTALRLNSSKLAALRKLVDTCTAAFESALRKRMIEDGCD